MSPCYLPMSPCYSLMFPSYHPPYRTAMQTAAPAVALAALPDERIEGLCVRPL